MDKLISWIKLTWAAFIAAPVIAPLLDLLHHRSVLVLLAGFAGFVLVPQIPNLSPAWRDNLGQFVFIGTLLLSGRFTLEGILKARGELPATMEDYLRALLTELISPTPDKADPLVANVKRYPLTLPEGMVWTPTADQLAYASTLKSPQVAAEPAPRPTLPVEQQAVNG